MKSANIMIFALAVLLMSGCADSTTGGTSSQIPKNEKKVVGYLPYYKFSYSDQIEYCKLTHLNLAFANPDVQGNIIITGDIDKVVNDARNANPGIIISISLAGAVLSPVQEITWSSFIDDPDKVMTLVAKIIDFVNDHDLDGVDVDLE